MLKAKVDHSNGPLIIFGLSKINITKLQDSMPIKIDLAELGMQGEVFIFAGDTEASMMTEIEAAGMLPAAKSDTNPN